MLPSEYIFFLLHIFCLEFVLTTTIAKSSIHNGLAQDRVGDKEDEFASKDDTILSHLDISNQVRHVTKGQEDNFLKKMLSNFYKTEGHEMAKANQLLEHVGKKVRDTIVIRHQCKVRNSAAIIKVLKAGRESDPQLNELKESLERRAFLCRIRKPRKLRATVILQGPSAPSGRTRSLTSKQKFRKTSCDTRNIKWSKDGIRHLKEQLKHTNCWTHKSRKVYQKLILAANFRWLLKDFEGQICDLYDNYKSCSHNQP